MKSNEINDCEKHIIALESKESKIFSFIFSIVISCSLTSLTILWKYYFHWLVVEIL